uniref:Uncharacterized protein n=1 Tax=Zea mays TaxID=4577 RepID=B7ZZI0_MAIZE|nr:unknown [Zea mays]
MAEQPSRWPPRATSSLACLLSTQVAQAPTTRVTRARYFMFSRQAGRGSKQQPHAAPAPGSGTAAVLDDRFWSSARFSRRSALALSRSLSFSAMMHRFSRYSFRFTISMASAPPSRNLLSLNLHACVRTCGACVVAGNCCCWAEES